jgi:hypothetical protein
MPTVGILQTRTSLAGIDLFEEGLLLPVPGLDPNTVALEERDGTQVLRLDAHEIFYREGDRLAFKASNVNIGAFVTACRVAFACAKYDKGGGWYGDPVSMVVMNAGSKLAAAQRTRGTTLAGQVRYPWLIRVGSTSKNGLRGAESLVVDAKAENGDTHRLQLNLTSHGDAAQTAHLIAQRAAHHMLACADAFSDYDRSALNALTRTPELSRGSSMGTRDILFYEFPRAYFANEQSARLDESGQRPEGDQPASGCPTCGGRPDEDGWCLTCGENLRPDAPSRFSRDAAARRRQWRAQT